MADDEYDDRDHSHELVMPFVTVDSVGGPHDDESFVAGFSCGLLDAKLADRRVAAMTEMFSPTVRAQCDLIAMRYGYTCDLLAEPDGWVHLGFTRVDVDELVV